MPAPANFCGPAGHRQCYGWGPVVRSVAKNDVPLFGPRVDIRMPDTQDSWRTSSKLGSVLQ